MLANYSSPLVRKKWPLLLARCMSLGGKRDNTKSSRERRGNDGRFIPSIVVSHRRGGYRRTSIMARRKRLYTTLLLEGTPKQQQQRSYISRLDTNKLLQYTRNYLPQSNGYIPCHYMYTLAYYTYETNETNSRLCA